MLCKAYLTSYRLPVIVTRGNNVYGPHQFPEKMVPKFTLLAARGKELPIHGDGLVSEGRKREKKRGFARSCLFFTFFGFC